MDGGTQRLCDRCPLIRTVMASHPRPEFLHQIFDDSAIDKELSDGLHILITAPRAAIETAFAFTLESGTDAVILNW